MAHDDIDRIVKRGWKRFYITGSIAIIIFAGVSFFSQALCFEMLKAGATGIVFASVAYCFTWYRNWTVERTLRESLTPKGVDTLAVGESPNSLAFGVTITNHTGRKVTVRDVKLYTESTRQTITPNLLGKYPNVIQPNYRTDKTTTCSVSNKAVQEFVELPPYTEATWGFILNGDNPAINQEIRGCSVLFEYPRLLGDAMLVRVEAPKEVAEMMNGIWNGIRRKLQNLEVNNEYSNKS